MSNLEISKIKDIEYVSFVKYLTFMQKSLVIKKHIGKNTGNLTKEEFMLNNIEEITNIELNFRKQFLVEIKGKISHSDSLPEKVEEKSILIDNYVEAKNIKELFDVKFAKKFIYNSNNIEGSRIPEEEVERIIETGKTKYKNRNEVREVENSIKAHKYLQEGFRFNLSSIKRLYYILTKDLLRDNGLSYPKGFKNETNIAGIEGETTTPPELVEKELQELLDWYKKNRKKLHPLILAFNFHLKYEKIHPFQDGNGRTGRMLMNKILISGNYNPIIVFKENRTAYSRKIGKEREKNYYQFMLEQANKTYDFLLEYVGKI